MNHANPTAIIAGAKIERLPVISATISMTANGAREMLPKQHIMPTITKGAGLCPIEGRSARTVARRGADEGTDDHARSEDATGPSRTDGEPGGHDASERQDEDDPQGEGQELVAQALLYPPITGAEDLRISSRYSPRSPRRWPLAPAREPKSAEDVRDP